MDQQVDQPQEDAEVSVPADVDNISSPVTQIHMSSDTVEETEIEPGGHGE